MINYFRAGKATLFGNWIRYVYLDTDEMLAESLFFRHMIHTKLELILGKKEQNELYRVVVLKVRKRDEQKFLQTMEELKNKMLLCGHPDYESHGGEMFDELRTALMED